MNGRTDKILRAFYKWINAEKKKINYNLKDMHWVYASPEEIMGGK